MKITYTLTAKGAVSCSSVPGPLRVDDVDVEWAIAGSALNGIRLIMRNQHVPRNPATGIFVVHDPARDTIAFRVASFLADTVYALTGVGAFKPDEVFARSPDLAGETPQEKAELSQAGQQRLVSAGASANLSRNLNGTRLASSVPQALAIAYYARAMRATDPFEKFQELYKVVEALAPSQLTGTTLDQWVSGRTVGVDPTFTERRVAQLRHLRTRMTHPQARLGHLDPHDLQHIQEACANLPDMDLLARILIWSTPTPWV